VTTDGKEPEMTIGFPTDVKHVAHIGWDGPSATTTNNAAAGPTWVSQHHQVKLAQSAQNDLFLAPRSFFLKT
jgi:hypothetical protein